jgi:type I restriction enzyme S subunit
MLPEFGGHCSTEIFPLRPAAALDRRFLYYWLTSAQVVDAIDRTCTGARMPRANVDAVMQFRLRLPPLAEQRRIVAILEEAFEGIAAATANAEKNLANARELFQSELNQIFRKKGGDAYQPLGEIANFEGGSQPPKSTFDNAPKERYVRLIQIRDFKTDKYACYVPISAKNRLCSEHDILIGRYGASVGQIHRGKAGAYNVALIKAVPIETQINREYFYYYLRSELFQAALANVASRSAQNGFGKEDISSFGVPMPDLVAQGEKVKTLKRASQHATELRGIYERKLALLAELKQSILHRAFNGDVTPAEALAA